MKVLLDTNIIIHRETHAIRKPEIGELFKWLDDLSLKKCIHSLSVGEIEKHDDPKVVEAFKAKMNSYEIMKTQAPTHQQITDICEPIDVDESDKIDSKLLNELINNRVDLFISEDKKIKTKARLLGIDHRLFTIDAFLEKALTDNPKLKDYKVLAVRQELFGNIDLASPFFDSFKEDYRGFEKWFNGKANEIAYVCKKDSDLLAFLYVKKEAPTENYAEISPTFPRKKRLKIGALKVEHNGFRLGERFLKVAFDNALAQKVDEVYVTIFNKRPEHQRLIDLLETYGFVYWGTKTTEDGVESVYVREFSPLFSPDDPRKTFPYMSTGNKIFLIPIYPDYHTELLPDSILRNESPRNYEENEPHRNAIRKAYISRSKERNVKKGDVIIFYRTKTPGQSAYHSSCITSIGIVESKIDGIKTEEEFIKKCKKRSIFSDETLKKHWNWSAWNRPFIINFLYAHSFGLGNRINRKKLLDLEILSGAENEIRGLKEVSQEDFKTIIRETKTDERLIVD